VVGSAKRIEHYNNRMVSSQVDPVLAATNVAQKANFAEYVIDYVPLQMLVHQYLDGQGALPAEYFNYNAFAGEIYHVSTCFSGAAAVAAASDFVIKYTGMGCTAPRLKAVALVFGIVVP